MYQSLWRFMSVIVQTTPVIFVQSLSPPLPRGIPSYSGEFSFYEKWTYLEISELFSDWVFFLILQLAFNDIKLVVLSYFA